MQSTTRSHFIEISPVAKLALSALAVGTLSYHASAASLTYDLRATTIVSGAGSVINGKSVQGVDVGSIVQFDLVAVVVGNDTNASNDGYAFGYFTLLTTNANNAVLGNLGSAFTGNAATSGVTFNGGWNTSGQNGAFATDVNADGGTDIGPATSNTNQATYAKARSSTTTGGGGTAGALSFSGTQINNGLAGAGQEFTLGTIQFKVASIVNPFNQTTINFATPPNLGITVKANWKTEADATQTTQGGVGVAVAISAVPEPSAFGMVMLGALSMVGFRRFGMRRRTS